MNELITQCRLLPRWEATLWGPRGSSQTTPVDGPQTHEHHHCCVDRWRRADCHRQLKCLSEEFSKVCTCELKRCRRLSFVLRTGKRPGIGRSRSPGAQPLSQLQQLMKPLQKDRHLTSHISSGYFCLGTGAVWSQKQKWPRCPQKK